MLRTPTYVFPMTRRWVTSASGSRESDRFMIIYTPSTPDLSASQLAMAWER